MNNKLKKHFLLFFLILCGSFAYSQKGEAVLILKDSTRLNGIGEISGISSIVSVKFKNDTLKYRTYRSKEIIGIDILENNYYRKFRFKYVDGGKFPEIMEIVSIDSLSLYVRVYEGSALSNSFSNEQMQILGNTPVQPVTFNNGQDINIGRSQNIYSELSFSRYSYYVGWGESDHVEHLYTKGLPFAKSFEKSMNKYFKSCQALIDKVENKEFSKDEVWRVLYFYNQRCLKTNAE